MLTLFFFVFLVDLHKQSSHSMGEYHLRKAEKKRADGIENSGKPVQGTGERAAKVLIRVAVLAVFFPFALVA
jgi:hypothetical protein